jgi:(p)ppGpp synthase/HD superfamily hydrolase
MSNHWSQDAYTQAYQFAARAHRGQLYPGTELPYVMHLSFVSIEVIAALQAEPGRDEALTVQCALLHDVIEDTEITYEQIADHFGFATADGVLALSKNKSLPKERQMCDSLQRITRQPQEVWMVKLADRISNLRSPPPYWDKQKASDYRQEALQIHNALSEASQFLSSRLMLKIERYRVHTL